MSSEYRDDVYELQNWLRRLAQAGEKLPMLIPDGIYGDETAEAVRMFQSDHGMPETGVVDFETWCAVRDKCRASDLARAAAQPAALFPAPDYCVCEGEFSDTVAAVQLMLAELSVAYDCFYDVPQSGFYDEDTIENVMHFQKINRLPETGLVDKETWNRLVKNYNTYANHPGYTG